MAISSYMWLDGKFVNFEDAKVNILTHSLQYGSGIFEGIRFYETSRGPAVFRLKEHTRRFFNSAKIYGMPLKINPRQFEDALLATVSKNGIKEGYIRPFGFYNSVGIGFNTRGLTTSVAIAVVPYKGLYGEHAKGLRCKVSSWQRINSAILPAEAKASGNYINSILAAKDAQDSGYDETILLSNNGKTVAEGPGDNIFVVQDGVLITPPKSSDILLGITRDTIIKLAEELKIPVQERDIRREELYTSDEAFFTGTAAEVETISSIDSRVLGDGSTGPVTSLLKNKYSDVVHGKDKKHLPWLTVVD